MTYAIDKMKEEIFALADAVKERDETIRSLRSRVEWQPVETAPKDGVLLLYGKHSRGGHNTCLVGFLDDRIWTSGEDGYGLYLTPTHWMPLPSPPLQDVEGESRT